MQSVFASSGISLEGAKYIYLGGNEDATSAATRMSVSLQEYVLNSNVVFAFVYSGVFASSGISLEGAKYIYLSGNEEVS